MGMNLAFALVLATAAQAAPSEWAPVAISDGDGSTLYFVDRASIKPTENGASAWIYAVGGATLKLHVEYDCDRKRFRYLEKSLANGEATARWEAIGPKTPIHSTMVYACAGGKVDLDFGDAVVRSVSPEAFARAFIAQRSASE